MLITSRNPHWHALATPIEIDTFARAESTALPRTRVPHLSAQDADRLAQALDDLPLALDQAAVPLADGLTVAQYRRLLDERIGQVLDHGRPAGHPVNLAAQIRLSTEHLATTDPAALPRLRALHHTWARLLGPGHEHTLWAANYLAGAHSGTGDHAAARDLNHDTLTRQRQAPGENHPHTLRTAANLAIWKRELGEE